VHPIQTPANLSSHRRWRDNSHRKPQKPANHSRPQEVRVTTTAQPPPGKVPVGADAERLAATLTERNAWLIQRVITVIGLERAEDLLQQTLAVEAQGGMLTEDQKRRRTPGGVFFKLVKAQTTPVERKAIFPHIGDRRKKPAKASQDPDGDTQTLPAVSWEEAQVDVVEMLKSNLGEATVKLTLVGRPLQVKELPSYTAIALQGKEPPSLPKGLPSPPAGSTMRFVVFIAHKQWKGVKDNLAQNPEDKLVIQGYPVFDPKTGATVVLAQQVQSVEQEKAKKAATKNTSKSE
jgi:hypothetical protein